VFTFHLFGTVFANYEAAYFSLFYRLILYAKQKCYNRADKSGGIGINIPFEVANKAAAINPKY
jgi:hypothetical protein